jgi:hypothetical protein
VSLEAVVPDSRSYPQGSGAHWTLVQQLGDIDCVRVVNGSAYLSPRGEEMEMLGRLVVAFGVLSAALVVAGAGSSFGAVRSGDVCRELPAQFRSLCTGPGVTCTTLSDAHSRWEAVLATEPTMAHAENMANAATAAGFGAMHIEKDVQCTNGYGVYEVAQARFHSQADAAAVVAQAKAVGFNFARTEDS